MSKKGLQYTDQQLYGPNGQPQLVDIQQNAVHDCYLVSSMGALAGQQPDRIREAIRYAPDLNDPDTGLFHVTLHHPTRGQVDVPVTQTDVEDNIQRKGGGTEDNKKGSPVWPSVMEAAFAKLHDPNPQNNSLDDAYGVIGNRKQGGSLHEAMFALTGDAGHNLRYSDSPKGHSGPPGSNKDERPSFDVKLYEKDVTRFNDANGAYAKINEALKSGNPVTVSTRSANVNDGLSPYHAYTVTGIEQHEKKDGSNEVLITLRNPYAKNINDPAENNDTSNPSITVSFGRVLKEGVFGEINIGPAPRVQTQQQNAPEPSTPAQATPTQPAPTQPASLQSIENDITNDQHPGHRRYQQALNAIEHSPNIPPGSFSGERLQQSAANIAYASLAGEARVGIGGHNESLSRIDLVVFNNDRSALIAVEGQLGNPTAQKAWLSSAQDNNSSLTDASQRMHSLLQDPQMLALANPMLQQTQAPPQHEPTLTGPSR